MKRALLVLAGPAPSAALLAQEAAQALFVLAADGAGAICQDLGLCPDAILGDMDSLPPDLPQLAAVPRLHLPDQNRSDGEKALLHLQALQFTEVVILGGLGGREDHFLYHCHLLAMPELSGMQLTLKGDQESLILVSGSCQLTGWPGRRISLLPLYGPTQVTATGLQWPLTGQTLAMGQACSLSNRFTGHEAQLSALPHPVAVVLEEVPL